MMPLSSSPLEVATTKKTLDDDDDVETSEARRRRRRDPGRREKRRRGRDDRLWQKGEQRRQREPVLNGTTKTASSSSDVVVVVVVVLRGKAVFFFREEKDHRKGRRWKTKTATTRDDDEKRWCEQQQQQQQQQERRGLGLLRRRRRRRRRETDSADGSKVRVRFAKTACSSSSTFFSIATTQFSKTSTPAEICQSVLSELEKNPDKPGLRVTVFNAVQAVTLDRDCVLHCCALLRKCLSGKYPVKMPCRLFLRRRSRCSCALREPEPPSVGVWEIGVLVACDTSRRCSS